MDPQASYNLSGDTVPFNLAEIWPFPMNGSATTTSFHNNNNATSSNRLASSISMTMTMNLNRDHDPIGGGGLRRRRPEDNESAKGVSTSNDANAMNEGDNKRIKKGGSNDNHESKAGGETNSVKPAEQTGKAAEPPKQDYIHVRARRGQATDNHSLAERARREKISERMKILQDLVPGCNKVTGKALVLDEIINYIQSLQHQVEFLSMKLEAVNSRVSPGIEGFPSKDFGQPPFDAFGSQSSREYHRDTSPEWLHMQIGGGFERT